MSLLEREELVLEPTSPSTQKWWESTDPHPEEWEPLKVPDVFRERVDLGDGLATNVYIIRKRLGDVSLSTECFPVARRGNAYLQSADASVVAAMPAGFFDLMKRAPIGDIWTAGERIKGVPLGSPWDGLRGALHSRNGQVSIDRRNLLPPIPEGDLYLAGPLLVKGGVPVVHDRMKDQEAFRAKSRMHDGNRSIIDGPHPRGAVGVCDEYFYGVVVDGRSAWNAGMTTGRLAVYGAERGILDFLNVDGGGNAFLAVRDKDGVPRIVNEPMSIRDRKRKYPKDPQYFNNPDLDIPDGTPYPTEGDCRETHTMTVITERVAA
jgi:hypothetical protein